MTRQGEASAIVEVSLEVVCEGSDVAQVADHPEMQQRAELPHRGAVPTENHHLPP
jgi:hypothetical protein